jgi:hypothetical protein
MLRRLAMPGFVFFLSISLLSLFLWARGFFYADFLYADYNTPTSLHSRRSSVTIDYQSHSPYRASRDWAWYARNVTANESGWAGLTNFSCSNSSRLWPSGPGREIQISAPIWLFTVLCTAIAWAFFRARGERNLKVRDDLRTPNPKLRRRLIRFAVFSITGAVLGAFVAWLGLSDRLYEDGWGIIGCLPVPFMTAVIVLTRRRIRWSQGALWMTLELAGGTCFFAAVVEQIWHANSHYDERDPLLMSLLFGIVSFFCGSVTLLLLQMKTEAKESGTYCPACGYCLIGVPTQTCPECGRPFTLDELGVSADALVPPVPSPADALSHRR